MKAFKNSNALNGNNGPGVAQAPAVFMARAAAQILILRTVKGALISSLARVINSNRGVIRPIQSSLVVDSIMCLPPVCVSEIRSFIRGL